MLTRQGGDYHRAVTRALDELREATPGSRGAEAQQLKVRAYTTFAMRWLIPRLPDFHARHPDIGVLLKASLEPVDFRKEDIDEPCAWARRLPGTNTYRLVPNILAPWRARRC